MIINTGQRTDIPAFYSKWFINRIREGFVLVRNPYYPSIVTKFILDPKVVDVIGFCTKNPRPMFPYLDEIKNFGQFWYVSITGFEKDLEPNNQEEEQNEEMNNIIRDKTEEEKEKNLNNKNIDSENQENIDNIEAGDDMDSKSLSVEGELDDDNQKRTNKKKKVL